MDTFLFGQAVEALAGSADAANGLP